MSLLGENKKLGRIYPTSKFRMCITKVKETEEDGEKKLKIVSQEWIQGNGKEFSIRFI